MGGKPQQLSIDTFSAQGLSKLHVTRHTVYMVTVCGHAAGVLTKLPADVKHLTKQTLRH
jgi:hypothetical protein